MTGPKAEEVKEIVLNIDIYTNKRNLNVTSTVYSLDEAIQHIDKLQEEVKL